MTGGRGTAFAGVLHLAHACAYDGRMQAARYFSGAIRTRNWLDRLLVLAVVLLLALQLLGSGQHKDDHIGHSGDCASCIFAHHVPHGLPGVDVAPAPAMAVVRYHLVPVVVRQAPAFFSFLIPQSQGPPRA